MSCMLLVDSVMQCNARGRLDNFVGQ